MPLRNRHKGADNPECPMGSDGPYLNDAMIEFACKLVIRMIEAVKKHQKIVIGLMHGEGDVGQKAFGGINYVFAMAGWIKELEGELKKSPIPGIDPKELRGEIVLATADEIRYADGRTLNRDGLNWVWSVECPDPE